MNAPSISQHRRCAPTRLQDLSIENLLSEHDTEILDISLYIWLWIFRRESYGRGSWVFSPDVEVEDLRLAFSKVHPHLDVHICEHFLSAACFNHRGSPVVMVSQGSHDHYCEGCNSKYG